MFSGVSYTEERAESMLFSDLPMGEEKYYLYADLVNTDITASDLTTLNGKRIGLLEGSVQATQFYAWEEEDGVQLEDVYVTSFEDAAKKVEDREMDCFISTETPQWTEVGMSAILTVGGSDIYFVVNKNRPDLKEQLDSAMRKMEYDKPFYADDLYQKYLSSVSSPVLTRGEQQWLAEHGPIRIGWVNGDAGVSEFSAETGAITGVLIDYVRFATDCLSNQTLEFDLVGFDSIEEEIQALKDGSIDLIFHMSQNPYEAEQNGFSLSNTVLSVNMAAVTNQSYFDENAANRVAIPKNDLLLKWSVAYNYPQSTSQEEALDTISGSGLDGFVPLPFFLSNVEEEAARVRELRRLGGKPEEKTSVLKGMRFLCAEDNELNAEILQAMLEMQGASCTICRNGIEIVERFRTVKPGEFDAILMDVQMPGMDGCEAARAIRNSENPLGRVIPIIAMTANAFAEDVQKSREAGMDEHLSKPVDMDVLEQTLRKFRVTPPRR